MRLLCYIFLVSIYVEHAFMIEYVPSNRNIEAIQNDRYIFGIEDDGKIELAICKVYADTGTNHTFLVRPTFSANQQSNNDLNVYSHIKQKENVVTDRGVEGLCQVIVSNVQHNGPKLWNLVVTDFYNQLVDNVTFTVDFYHSASLLKSEIRVKESDGFLNHMILPDDFSLKSCYVKINNTITLGLDVHTPKTTVRSSYTKNIEDLLERISSLGNGYCGLKFINSTRELHGIPWSLTAIGTSDSYRNNFVTRIDAEILETHSKMEVVLGQYARITCPNLPTSKFCTIYNPNGETVETRDCTYGIDSVTMKDIGLWRCNEYTSGAMKSTEHVIELMVRETRTVIGWKNETDHYINIGCALTYVSPVETCKMVARNNDVFNIEPGLVTDRYHTLGTNLSTSRCSMTIQKPLKEFEKGPWKCKLSDWNLVGGTVITTDDTIPVEYPKYLELTARKNNSFTINCNVPYSIDYCHIQSPLNVKYFPNETETLALGRCVHYVGNSSSYEGNWTCHLGRSTGEPDDIIVVNVAFADNLQSNGNVSIEVGGTAQLWCSARGLPLHYCRYVSPDGISYHIRDKDNSASRLSYFGRGLNYGDCGISLSNVTRDESGLWKCVTQLHPNNHVESSSQILLQVI